MRDHTTGPSGLPPNGHNAPGFPANGRTGGARAGAPAHAGRVNGDVRRPPFTRVLAPAGDADGTPDLVAVQADDELINALGARRPAPHRGPGPVDVPRPSTGHRDSGVRDSGVRDAGAPATHDDRLVAMLAAWRADIDADPIPDLVDLDTAVATVIAGVRAHESAAQESAARESAARESAARRRRIGRTRHLAPLAAAAAIVVAVVGGVGLGSQNAVPGDPLWQIQKVVNPERAESVEARVEVETRLAKVRTALRAGDTATAARELEAIRTQIPAVRAEEGLPLLVQEEEFLAAKLADTPPGEPADLSTPPLSNPVARSTSSPAAPVEPAPADPSSSGSAPANPAAPDVASVPAGPSDADAPASPADPSPAEPGPDVAKPPSPLTTAPDRTRPEEPVVTAPGPRNDEGGPDPTVAPAPVEPPPPSPAEDPAPEVTPTSGTTSTTGTTTGTTPGTTTASDAAGAGAVTAGGATT